ncbi:MAG: ketopantoate reductase C-terminal domain-containing protein, partial [Asgard group archaeon]|nr:ketopantoate reductase C-terminal domain-containing protein [Asgard group archaeon]
TDETLVYSFQNGLGNTEIMARYIPEEQIVAVVIGWGATNLGPGRFKVTSSSGNFVIGFEKSVTQKQQSKLHEMKKMLKCWKPTIITDKIKDYRWAKLIVNSIIAPLGALLGITVGEMFEHVKTRKIMTELKQEALLLVNKLDISLEKVDGIDIQNFFYRPQPQDGFFKRIRRPLMSRIINYIGARRHGNIRSSMLTDLKHDKKTEIDYLNGVLVGKASEINLELPLNAFILKAIKEIEAGKRVVGLHNLVELEKFAEISYDKTSQYFGKNR